MTTHKQGPIIAVGDLVWDVVVQPHHVLLPGGDTTGRIALSPGGSAANTAVWVARVGGDAGFVGSLGADFFGDAIARDLEAENVQCWLTRTNERDTGVVLVLVDQQGQRSMVTNQGADFVLRPEDLPEAVLRNAGHIHLTAWSLFNDPPQAAAMRAAQLGRAGGATISLDPASFQMIQDFGRDAFIKLFANTPIDILLPNRDEAQALTGERHPQRMAERLRQMFPGATIVIKLDNDGCYVMSDRGDQAYPTTHVQVMDTTGAGDSFDAAFLARYLATGDIDLAARTANAVAGWVVSRTGARPPVDSALRDILSALSSDAPVSS